MMSQYSFCLFCVPKAAGQNKTPDSMYDMNQNTLKFKNVDV